MSDTDPWEVIARVVVQAERLRELELTWSYLMQILANLYSDDEETRNTATEIVHEMVLRYNAGAAEALDSLRGDHE